MVSKEVRILRPQEGPQEAFLATSADICIYGGAAGGGKTYGLLLAALRHITVKGFRCTIFRKNYNQIFSPGGLWDEAQDIYSGIKGASPRISDASWQFRGKNSELLAKVTFAHIERDADLESWQGSQICFIGFDELTHFSEHTFFYMMSRNRSTCGVIPFIRATCNPDADSWVAKFIAWWIDQETGYPIPERSGVIRWMMRRDETITWADTKEELIEKFDLRTPEELSEPRSVTFIASRVEDNKELLRVNPSYLANLKALPQVERERLLHGNWKIKPAAGLFFRRTQVNMIQALPADVYMWVRGWDLAATAEDENGDPAYTAGVLMGKRRCGRYVVADVINKRLSASEVRNLIKMTAAADKRKYGKVMQRLPQDPGQAGKDQAQSYIKLLAGYVVKVRPESGSKETRAEPMAAQWQVGNFDVLEADWNDMYFSQLESFPESKFKDMVDGGSSAFGEIESGVTYSAPSEGTLEKESYWRK